MSKIKAPMEIKECEKFGRYMEATKDFSAGTLIFKEAPIFLYPDSKEFDAKETVFTCITCFRILKKTKRVGCKYCKWSFCSRRCSKDSLHRQLECDVFTKNKIGQSTTGIRYLFLLRMFQLKFKNKTKWDEITNLSCKFGRQSPDKNYDHLCKSAHKFLEEVCNMNVSLSEVKRLTHTIDVNAYSFVEKDESKTTCALYPTACFISHSCVPNADWCRHPGKNEERCTIAIIARRNILAGEMLTISYKFDHSWKGSQQRRASLLENFNFVCGCTRCDDPTELGTYFSAIKCSNCRGGWLLPSSIFEDKSLNCDKCSYSSQEEGVSYVKSFKRRMNSASEMTEMSKEKYLDYLIENATEEHNLHPNHHLVIEANKRWLQSLNDKVLLETSRKCETIFHKIIERAEKNLEMANLFGKISQRVYLNSLIAMTTSQYYFKSRNYISIRKDVNNLVVKKAAIERIVKHLRTGISIANPSLFGDWTITTVAILRKRYEKWNSRLTKCRAKSLKQNTPL